MISLHNLSLRRGTKILFENANFTLYQQQKIGIVGKNGCGKSSLFALILKELQPESGSLLISKDTRIAHVMQTILHTDQEVIEYVIDGDEKLRLIQRELKLAETEQKGEKIAQLHAQLEDAGGYNASARAAKLLDGLGFAHEQMYRKITELSGGWQMRLNLARALMQPSDILLLDEPTNHLDLDAVIWLEQWLCRYHGMLLLISHDREFLDRITTHTMHFEHQKITLYTGNYAQFSEQRESKLEMQEKVIQKQQKQRLHLQSYILLFVIKPPKQNRRKAA